MACSDGASVKLCVSVTSCRHWLYWGHKWQIHPGPASIGLPFWCWVVWLGLMDPFDSPKAVIWSKFTSYLARVTLFECCILYTSADAVPSSRIFCPIFLCFCERQIWEWRVLNGHQRQWAAQFSQSNVREVLRMQDFSVLCYVVLSTVSSEALPVRSEPNERELQCLEYCSTDSLRKELRLQNTPPKLSRAKASAIQC